MLRSPPTTAAAVFLLTCALTSPASAVDGFGDLKWGLNPGDVETLYPNGVRHDPEPKGAPEATMGGRLYLQEKAQVFDAPVEVSMFFGQGGLAVIRLQYQSPAPDNMKAIMEWYQPHWGQPIYRESGDAERVKRSWRWPWEGVSLREVLEDGTVKYQRVDFSRFLIEQWKEADTVACSVLPPGSGCDPAPPLCPNQDESMPVGKRTQMVTVANKTWQASCAYASHSLSTLRLRTKEPSSRMAEWVQLAIERRAGTSTTTWNDATKRTSWAGAKLTLETEFARQSHGPNDVPQVRTLQLIRRP